MEMVAWLAWLSSRARRRKYSPDVLACSFARPCGEWGEVWGKGQGEGWGEVRGGVMGGVRSGVR